MEILFITHKYPPIIGGMEKHSFELTTRMAKNHKVHMHVYDGAGSKLMWFFGLRSAIKRILREHPGIELIHLNDGLMGATTLWLKRFTKIPVVATFHGLDITFPSRIFQKWIVPKMHRFDGVICVSRATAQASLERGFDKNKVYTVLNGVDHDLADIPIETGFKARVEEELGVRLAEKKIVLTMGRAVKRKGFSWFLKHVLPSLDEQILFLMVGPLNTKPGLLEKLVQLLPHSMKSKVQLMFGMATDVKDIVRALKDPKTSGCVFHLGKVSFKDLMQYLALADVFVMPNIKVEGDAEGFGLVALEASLRGAPVVAAGIEGITDAVRDGKNGIQLPTADTAAWIETLNALASDEKRLAEMSQMAVRTTLEDYGWDKMVKEYEEVFVHILSNT